MADARKYVYVSGLTNFSNAICWLRGGYKNNQILYIYILFLFFYLPCIRSMLDACWNMQMETAMFHSAQWLR